jgi:lysylphosphatidylglycerol synthetase-like protein (DUF2156 family)
MSIKKIVAAISALSTSLFLFAGRVHAKPDWIPGSGFGGDMSDLIRMVLNMAIIMSSVAAVVFLVYNGFKYMMAAGDTAKTEEAQKGIANALIGLVICLAAAVIVKFVMDSLDVEQEELSYLSEPSPVVSTLG